MEKTVHVNSYVKRDGTQVREHFRTIATDDYRTPPIVPEYPNYPVMDEKNNNPLDDLFPNIFNPTMGMDSVPVLQGGVSVDVGFPDNGATAGKGVLGNIFEGAGGVIGSIAQLLPLALEIYAGLQSGGAAAGAPISAATDAIMPVFNKGVQNLTNYHKQIKTDFENSVKKLVNATNKAEYAKLYKPVTELHRAYTQTGDLLTRIKAHANNGDFQSVANDLGNFVSESPAGKAIISNPMIQDVITNLQKNFYNPNGMTFEEQVVDTIAKVGSKMMPVAGANLQNAMQDFSYAKKNPNAHILNSRTEITNQGLSRLMEQVGIPENTRGVIYDNNSVQSQILWQSPEMQDFVRNNFINLLIDKTPKTYDIEFVVRQNFEGLDNFAGLQHCKLYNPQITPDGYFKGIIVDYYDFEYRDYTDDVKKNLFIYANNWGYKMQEKDLLENQFNIYIIFEKLW